jgi:hypothetical protein
MEVAAWVLQTGGSEAQAAAGALASAMDRPEAELEDIQKQLGVEVRRLVETFLQPEPNESDRERAARFAREPGQIPWFVAKAAYLRKLADRPDDELHAVACLEYQEIREMMMDFERFGAEVFRRYPAPAAQLFWYHRELLQLFLRRLRSPLLAALTTNYATQLRKLQEVGLPS